MTDITIVAGDKEAISATLNGYFTALGKSNTEEVLQYYAPDAVFMPQHIPTVSGVDAIRSCYDQIFQAIQLTVQLDVIEVVPFSSDYAFARTASAGVQKDLKGGGESKESNQELFVMQKVSGDWKIARYCFCTTNPPK